MIPYGLLAVRTFVSESEDVADYVTDRVYVGELPEAQAKTMPRAAIVLSPSGGPPDSGYIPLARQRMDTRCYGGTPLEAMRVHLAMHEVLKYLVRGVRLNCLIHSVELNGGPVSLRDNDIGAEWPMVFASYTVLASEVSLAESAS